MAPGKQDLQKIKDLIELMKTNDLVKLEIIDGENKILLKRPHPAVNAIPMAPAPVVSGLHPQAEQPQQEQPQAFEEESSLVEIKSPIVGTFYSAPSPDSESYVNINSRVEPDTIICIVEAMKVMNEIKAETSGTIVEIICQQGQAVEYGQLLFRVRPD